MMEIMHKKEKVSEQKNLGFDVHCTYVHAFVHIYGVMVS